MPQRKIWAVGAWLIPVVAFATWASAHAAGNPSRVSGGTLPGGSALYAQSCAYCHGTRGQGGVRLGAPKLWGPGNVVSGSAYGTVTPLSQFIKQYMPLDPVNGVNPGSLTTAQSQSLARYILSQR